VLGIAATQESATKVPYSLWVSAPAIAAYGMFAVAVACFVCATREVPIPYPINRRTRDPLLNAGPSMSAGRSPALPAAPVRIRLVPEHDVMAGGFRLVAQNRGGTGRFRAEVTSIQDQEGQPPAASVSGWSIPWLDDGTITSRDIPEAGSSRLDFAYFTASALPAGLEGARRLSGDYWTFPSLPETVKVEHPTARTRRERDQRFFIVTVRVTRDDLPGHADTQFKIGIDGQGPYCRRLLNGSTVADEPAGSERSPSPPAPAVTDRWVSSTQFVSNDLLQLQSNSMTHPAYTSRSPHGPPPASVRIGIDVASTQLRRDTPPTSVIRSSFLAFLATTEVMDLIMALADVTGLTWKPWDERPRSNFAAVLSSDDDSHAPAAWARLLLSEDGASQFGRDPRRASFVLNVELPIGPEGSAPAVGLVEWHQRFALAARLPEALAEYLTADLGLTTSSDPQAEVAVWLKPSSMSLTDLVDVNGFTVVPGVQASWFIGLARSDPQGQDVPDLAVTWTTEMCDAIHLDGHETALGQLRSSGRSGPA